MSTRGRSPRAALGSALAGAAHQALISKETKALISDVVEKIDDGGRLVQQAGNTVQEGGGSVHRVSDIAAEISAAGAARASRRPGRRRRVEPDLEDGPARAVACRDFPAMGLGDLGADG